VLVHGDFSPNIFVGAQGPAFTTPSAWYGTRPSIAFVLNHLLLKGVGDRTCAAITWRCSPRCAPLIAHARRGNRGQLESRTAALLPALLLARVGGKSPVEYVTRDADRNATRLRPRPFIASGVELDALAHAWAVNKTLISSVRARRVGLRGRLTVEAEVTLLVAHGTRHRPGRRVPRRARRSTCATAASASAAGVDRALAR
jgi:hypothetical protein